MEVKEEVAIQELEEEMEEEGEVETPSGVTNANAHFARGMPLW